MKKAGLAVLLLGAALCIPGCGFEEGKKNPAPYDEDQQG